MLAEAALQFGRNQGFLPLCVTVLDTGGHSLVALRDERAAHYRHVIASAKAAGCLGMGMGGREITRRATAMPAFYGAVIALTGGGLAPVAGGVLIRDHAGRLLGAVGVSGDTADNDELCAVSGITVAGFAADTGAVV